MELLNAIAQNKPEAAYPSLINIVRRKRSSFINNQQCNVIIQKTCI